MLRTVFEWAGYAATLLVFYGAVKLAFLWARGILPVLLRLGFGLSRRRVAIFARGDDQASLQQLLIDSGLFSPKNIIAINSAADVDRSAGATVFLVYWPHWKGQLELVLSHKRDRTPIVVYAPPDQGFLPQGELTLLNSRRNALVTNFRGRLINDLVSSLITTSYEQD